MSGSSVARTPAPAALLCAAAIACSSSPDPAPTDDAATAVFDAGQSDGPLSSDAGNRSCAGSDANPGSCFGYYDVGEPKLAYPYRFLDGESTCFNSDGKRFECSDGKWEESGSCLGATGCEVNALTFADGAEVCQPQQGLFECVEGEGAQILSGRCYDRDTTYGAPCESEYEVDADTYWFHDGVRICRAETGAFQTCENGVWITDGSCEYGLGTCTHMGKTFAATQNVCFDEDGQKQCQEDGTFIDVAPYCWTTLGPLCAGDNADRTAALPFDSLRAFSLCPGVARNYYFDVSARSRVRLDLTTWPSGWEPELLLGDYINGECVAPMSISKGENIDLEPGRYQLTIRAGFVGVTGKATLQFVEEL